MVIQYLVVAKSEHVDKVKLLAVPDADKGFKVCQEIHAYARKMGVHVSAEVMEVETVGSFTDWINDISTNGGEGVDLTLAHMPETTLFPHKAYDR